MMEEYRVTTGGQDWVVSWHSPVLPPPEGRRHGSAAICFTSDEKIVLVSHDGESWSLPGGRPESGEDWRQTLDREMAEEACARVEEATLLGFAKSVCTRGREEGLVLVRALWHAKVMLLDWDPQYEVKERLLVAPGAVMAALHVAEGNRPIFQRWLSEASAVQGVRELNEA